ncbi:MAG: hypothetical protein GY950_02650 [bacterium]|nr:hypothetical protein [bacterium]
MKKNVKPSPGKKSVYMQEYTAWKELSSALRDNDITKDKLLEKFSLLSRQYEKLLKKTEKLIRISDSYHKRLMELNEQTAKKNKILEEALDRIEALSGLLPICCNCKKIRDDDGEWNAIENYISKHSDAEFSHSLCPDCFKDIYPNYPGKPADE